MQYLLSAAGCTVMVNKHCDNSFFHGDILAFVTRAYARGYYHARPCVCVCVCVCFVFIPSILGTSRSLSVQQVDAPAGATQKETSHRGFLRPPFAVLAFIFFARRVQPPLSPFPRERSSRIRFTNNEIALHSSQVLLREKNPSSCDFTE